MTNSNKSKTISIRMSELMLEALDERAILEKKDRTQVIREAVSKYLDLPKEDKLEILEERQNKESERIDSLEIRIENLEKIIKDFQSG